MIDTIINDMIKYATDDIKIISHDYDKLHTSYIIHFKIFEYEYDAIYVFDDNCIYIYDIELSRDIIQMNDINENSDIYMLYDVIIRYTSIRHICDDICFDIDILH